MSLSRWSHLHAHMSTKIIASFEIGLKNVKILVVGLREGQSLLQFSFWDCTVHLRIQIPRGLFYHLMSFLIRTSRLCCNFMFFGRELTNLLVYFLETSHLLGGALALVSEPFSVCKSPCSIPFCFVFSSFVDKRAKNRLKRWLTFKRSFLAL